MVYPGRPSTGCTKCIARRVKCDEGKPECNRCLKRDESCPGYRDPKDVKFIHNSGKRKPKTIRSASLGRGHSSPPPLSLLRQPKTGNWEEQVTCFFFHRYTIQNSHNGSLGWLGFLPELYQQSEDNSALAYATRAASFASFSCASPVKHLAVRGHQSYGLALKMVNASLGEPDEVMKDSLIVAILLLAIFENFYRERPAILKGHVNGLRILISMRGADQFQTSRGWAIFRQVHTQMQAQSLELGEHPGPETVRWMQVIDRSLPETRSAWCTFRLTQLNATAVKLFSEPVNEVTRERLHSLLDEAQDLETEFSQWQDGASPYWKFQAWNIEGEEPVEMTANGGSVRESSEESSESRVRTQRILTYHNLWFSNVWNGHRIMRFILHELILRVANRIGVNEWNLGNIETSTSLIDELLEETCDSIPFTIDEVQVNTAGYLEFTPMMSSGRGQGSAAGAYFLLWPLYRIVISNFAKASQRTTATDAMTHIGHKFGIRLALTLAQLR